MQTVAKYADCRKIQSGFSQLIQTETRNKRIHNTVLKLTRPGLQKYKRVVHRVIKNEEVKPQRIEYILEGNLKNLSV